MKFVYSGRMERLIQKVFKSILPIRNSICKAKITSIRIAHSPQEPARRELQGGLHAPTEEIRPCLWHLCHLCRGTHWALGGSQVIVYGWSISTDARDWAQVQTWVWGDGVNMGKTRWQTGRGVEGSMNFLRSCVSIWGTSGIPVAICSTYPVPASTFR